MIFRQLVDSRSSTYTYLLADSATRDAVLIDPVFELYARDAALVRELGLTLRCTLETHLHADHVTAAWLFHVRAGSAIVVSAAGGAIGADREVRASTPRLGGARSEADFVGFMANLGLPHPKQIDVALPANLRCGRPIDGDRAAGNSAAGADEAEWAAARRTFAGVLEVETEWLGEHLGDVEVVDVREPDEWNGELGRIPGARHLPLGELRA